MENQTIQMKTAELIAASKENNDNTNLCKVGNIHNGIYCAIADGIENEIDAGIWSMKCNEALESRMILNKQTLPQAIETAVNQYREIYIPAAQLAGHTPVNFENFLVRGIV